MTQAQIDAKEQAEALTKQLVNLTNAYGFETAVAAGIFKGLANTHNTLQQAFWRSMQGVITQYAEYQYFDLRNEASQEFCKAIVKLIPDHSLPMI